ncbi:M20/M25/M40 family metallo-hydrolase, partial [Sphingobium sp.]|uniref:M20/M25/M40 family metallo-hydrolase n=1 Tax=Sphingobium sp. TaxID=1912891 RepID=UPI002BDB1717
MTHLSLAERRLLDHAATAPMLHQVQDWAAINSGSRNLDGLARMADRLADAFSALPGQLRLVDALPVESVASDGKVQTIFHGRHLHLSVRPDAPIRLLLTGHMDTVFPADHAFQHQRWLEPGILNGPGVADMKGGIAVMLAALSAIDTSEAVATLGYDVIINS